MAVVKQSLRMVRHPSQDEINLVQDKSRTKAQVWWRILAVHQALIYTLFLQQFLRYEDKDSTACTLVEG